MKLKKDLYSIYGGLLAKKDEDINSRVVRRIRNMGDRHKQVRVLLKNTDIYNDFKNIFEDKRYTTMFSPPVSKKDILATAGRLRIEDDLLLELSVMRKNLPYTYNHVMIVAAFAIKISLLHKTKTFDRELVSHCGFTHDIGKTRIPVNILNKSKRLNRAERAIIETHPTIGYLLLNYYLKKDRMECALASLDHHERLDGSGYPNGVRTLNKYTQLISAIDVMDALLTKRPYRNKAFELRPTLDYLLREAESGRINKDIALTLISMARKDKPDITSIKISTKARKAMPEQLTHDKYR